MKRGRKHPYKDEMFCIEMTQKEVLSFCIVLFHVQRGVSAEDECEKGRPVANEEIITTK